MVGIYAIIQRFTGKIYIGSSVNISKRFKQHKLSLITDMHHNTEMQKDFNLYDCDLNLFFFIVLKKLPEHSPNFYIHSIERKYIERFKRVGEVYNIGIPSKQVGMSKLTMKLILIKKFFTKLFEYNDKTFN